MASESSHGDPFGADRKCLQTLSWRGPMYHTIRDVADDADVRHTLRKILVVDENVEDLNYHAELFEAQGL
jgi:hypothetical protein